MPGVLDWLAARPFSDWAAALALLLSVYAVVTSTRLQRRQVRQMDREEAARQKADVRVELTRDFTDSRLVIRNVGQSVAHDVRLALDIKEGMASPLEQRDYDSALPISTLLPGEEVRLRATINLNTDTKCAVRCSWSNEDGTPGERSARVSL